MERSTQTAAFVSLLFISLAFIGVWSDNPPSTLFEGSFRFLNDTNSYISGSWAYGYALFSPVSIVCFFLHTSTRLTTCIFLGTSGGHLRIHDSHVFPECNILLAAGRYVRGPFQLPLLHVLRCIPGQRNKLDPVEFTGHYIQLQHSHLPLQHMLRDSLEIRVVRPQQYA
jgi:hypothetical protein